MLRKIFFIGFVLSAIWFLIQCDTNEPPTNSSLSLRLEEVSCTEAWITLTTTNLQLPTSVTFKQNDQIRETINLNKADTLLYVDSLSPNQTYKFQSVIQSINQSSNELSITTMDTTSHNFSFQSWTFGEHSSSVLYDVTIIDETNILAVGEIYMNDSLGQPDPNAYNVVRWDGNDWTIGRIAFTGGCHIIYPPIRSIWSFSENDIWFASGGSLVHYDGINYDNDCSMNSIITPPLNKIWGTSSSDLYVVGSKGTIIRFNGTLWWRMGSVTTLDITDIWGDYNNKIGKWEILAVASNLGSSLEKEIFQIKNNTVILIPTGTQMWPLKTVWFIPERQYYVAGAGIYQKRLLTDSIWKNEALDITAFSTYSIRGNNINDVIGVGAFGDFVHFNGVTWKNDYVEPNLNYGSYKSVYVKENIIVAVGDEFSQAVVLKAKK